MKDGKAQNEIGLNFKFTKVNRGSINFTGYKEAILDYRKTIVYPKVQKAIDTYVAGTYKTDKQKVTILNGTPDYSLTKSRNELFKNKEEEFYEMIAVEEINFLKEFKAYKSFKDSWWSIEAFLPVTEKEYTLITDEVNGFTLDKSFRPWTLSGDFNYLYKRSGGLAILFNLRGEIFNNNNIDTKRLTPFTLLNNLESNEDLQISTQSVYSGIFRDFVTSNVEAGFTSFFLLDGFTGISASVEQNFGDFDAVGWKLGIPFSLKDKKGKPSVSFELQWREQNKEHLVGIAVGYSFGKFLQ